MKNFSYVNAATIDDAVAALGAGRSKVIAGGTDILGAMKDNILPDYPELIVNVKTISGLDTIREEEGVLRIGALTKIADIANNKSIRTRYRALAEAASRTASPQIREMGTIGGNICQSVRCWYYWFPHNRFYCIRKSGRACPALIGENKYYHSIFGAAPVVDPPCSSNCPANVDIPTYLSKLREGDWVEAGRLLLDYNPLPSITGRVCPHFCETECNRSELDHPISIRAIERELGDFIVENAREIFAAIDCNKNKRIAIVGSGPAGLSAAFYLRARGYDVSVIDRAEQPGGMLFYGIPAYRLPKSVVQNQVGVLRDMGIEFRTRVNVGTDVSVQHLMESFDAVFLACGAWIEKDIGMKGEELVISSLDFLSRVNAGSRELPGQKIAVIGGGNSAIDTARTLLRMGAEPRVLYRRGEMEMPAIKEEIRRAREEGIQFDLLTLPLEASEQNGKIALECVSTALGLPDESGRCQFECVEGTECTNYFNAVIKATGQIPDTSLIPSRFLDENGQPRTESSRYHLGENLFAGGDYMTGPGTVVQAITAGREAATLMTHHLETAELKTSDMADENIFSPKKFNVSYFKKMAKAKILEVSISERIKNIELEEVLGFGATELEQEINRCLNCGCVATNPSDIAPALIALDAKIKTTKRVIDAENFFRAGVEKTTILTDDEIITEIQLTRPGGETKSKFIKFALRKSIDFAIVNCATMITYDDGKVKDARICLNAVYNTPYRASDAEKAIIGKSIDESISDVAGSAAVSNVCPMPDNKYKAQVAKALVKKTILACK